MGFTDTGAYVDLENLSAEQRAKLKKEWKNKIAALEMALKAYQKNFKRLASIKTTKKAKKKTRRR